MELGSAIAVLLRRWLIVLVGLALTLGLGFYVFTSTPQRHQAKATLLMLLPAESDGSDEPDNPFLNLSNGLSLMARLVTEPLSDRDFQDDMVDKGFASSFSVAVDLYAPIITVGVEGTDRTDVIATRDELIRVIQENALTLQEAEQAPPSRTAQARVHPDLRAPEALSGSKIRAVLATLAAGMLVTLLVAFSVEHLCQLNKHRQPDSSATIAAPST